METQKAESKKHILSYGLLLGVLSIVLGVILYATNAYLKPSFIFSIIGFLILITCITLGIKAFKKDNNGYLSLSDALKIGLGIALIGGIIGALWILILTKVLEPDYANQMAEVQRQTMAEKFPNMTESQMNDALEMSAKFTSSWITMAFSLIGNLFFGFLIALVAGLVMKNKNPYEA